MPNYNIVKHAMENLQFQPYRFMENEYEYENEEESKAESVNTDFESGFQKSLRESEEILSNARIQSEQMKQEAWDKGKQEGYEQGYGEGYDEGYRKAYADMTVKMQAQFDTDILEMKTIIESVELQKNKVLEAYIDELKQICLAVAEKIILTSLKSSGEVIKRMILSATDKIKKTQWAKIFISKKDSDLLVLSDAQLLKELSHLSDNLKIVVMENEEQGTCILELPHEIIDASVNTQLENIKDILNNARL